MDRRLSHDDLRELLGAFALDAVDDEEREVVKRHLVDCLACRTEVAEHREMAGLLAAGWVPAPEGLWDRIAGSLEEAAPPMGLAPVVPIEAARSRRFGSGVRIAAAVAAAGSVAAAAVLGLALVETNQKLDDVAAMVRDDELGRAAAAAAVEPSARNVALRSDDGRLTADAVLLRDGTGYLLRSNLPDLPTGRTYQLWAVVGGSRISVGVLGGNLGPAAFHADGAVSALAITEEAAGGVVVSQQAPKVLGTVA